MTRSAAAMDRRLARLERRDYELTPEESTEGGVLHVYYARSAPRPSKIVAYYYGETGQAASCIYLDSVGELYVNEQLLYDRPLSGKVVKKYVDRVWMDGKQLLRWVDSAGKDRALTDSAAVERGRESTDHLSHLLNILNGLDRAKERLPDYRCAR